METALANTIAGLRACKASDTPVSPALRNAALELLVRAADVAWRLSERDRIVRAAAGLYSESSIEALAKELLQETRALRRTWAIQKHQSPRTSGPTVRDLLREANLVKELPHSFRQFRRILEKPASDIEGMAMSAETA